MIKDLINSITKKIEETIEKNLAAAQLLAKNFHEIYAGYSDKPSILEEIAERMNFFGSFNQPTINYLREENLDCRTVYLVITRKIHFLHALEGFLKDYTGTMNTCKFTLEQKKEREAKTNKSESQQIIEPKDTELPSGVIGSINIFVEGVKWAPKATNTADVSQVMITATYGKTP